jgi:tetratricopeptide (TPR) repeat protein
MRESEASVGSRPAADGEQAFAMTEFSLHDVVKLAGLSRAIVRRLAKARIVMPLEVGAGELRFGFRDLIVLRAARGLYASNVPPRRVSASLRTLRERLPADLPLSGLRVCVADGEVVVHDRGARWHAASGQLLLDFEALPRAGGVIVERPRTTVTQAVAHFESACALEDEDPEAACERYRLAIACDARAVHAYINLGCLLHAMHRWSEAEVVYRTGLEACGEVGTLLFNLAVLLEDRGVIDEAIASYRAALEADPGLADAHFNLARLYAAMGRSREALRAYNDYRRLAPDAPEP